MWRYVRLDSGLGTWNTSLRAPAMFATFSLAGVAWAKAFGYVSLIRGLAVCFNMVFTYTRKTSNCGKGL
jgi:hypothetical protein